VWKKGMNSPGIRVTITAMLAYPSHRGYTLVPVPLSLDLDLTLAPGATGGQVELGLGQLRPGRTYNVSGTDQRLTADPHGRATLPIHLHTRTHIHIAPEV